jgi:hypothetical protein
MISSHISPWQCSAYLKEKAQAQAQAEETISTVAEATVTTIKDVVAAMEQQMILAVGYNANVNATTSMDTDNDMDNGMNIVTITDTDDKDTDTDEDTIVEAVPNMPEPDAVTTCSAYKFYQADSSTQTLVKYPPVPNATSTFSANGRVSDTPCEGNIPQGQASSSTSTSASTPHHLIKIPIVKKSQSNTSFEPVMMKIVTFV